MKNVSGKYLSILLFSTLLLTNCKSPELEVSSLGKKLPAPSMKGSSPFDQDFETQNYALVQGSCDARVGNLMVSFDKSVWHQAPASPDLTGTNLPVGTQNDNNCSDGSFSIYLTKGDLLNIWGITSGSSGTNVDYIYIKGETLIGDTETLTIVDSSNGGGTGGNNGPASTIALEKTWPRGFAGSAQCENFRVNLRNSSGFTTTHTSDVSFSLDKKVSDTTYPQVSAFKSWQDCYNNANAAQTFTIPAGTDGIDVVYRFPDAPLDGLLEFKLSSPSALTVSSSYIAVTLRESSAGSTYRFLELEENPHQIAKSICYPFKIRARNYDKGDAYDQFPGTLTASSSSPQVQFYDDSNCSTAVSSYSFASYTSTLTGYIKYVPSAADTGSFNSFNLSFMTASGSFTYDAKPFEMRVDLSSSTSPTTVQLWGPRFMDRGMCQRFRVVTTNNNNTQVPVSTPTDVNLATLDAGAGSFYHDSTCSSVTTNKVTLAAQSSSMEIYFKPTATASGTYKFNISAAGLTAHNPDFVMKLAPTKSKIYMSNLTAGGCQPVSIGLSDDLGNTYVATYNITIPLTVGFSPSQSSRTFVDSTCTTPMYSSSVTIANGMGAGVFYIQTDSLNGVTVNINTSGTNGLIGDYFTGLFN
ncbi:hypothetical protein QJS83_09485 [Bdellovibrio sp. 22V]|uniref:hypothetical protein n=1 Tax=Bdellovibrio sp. 22V TaxID=3044166 RepID=UPI002543B953|nr:hypothetical protein [Bdellovibrio sp. 22V]WII70690.1 hypothetical protein QJS83_09485 [Bdellovibrio sp. 22V]